MTDELTALHVNVIFTCLHFYGMLFVNQKLKKKQLGGVDTMVAAAWKRTRVRQKKKSCRCCTLFPRSDSFNNWLWQQDHFRNWRGIWNNWRIDMKNVKQNFIWQTYNGFWSLWSQVLSNCSYCQCCFGRYGIEWFKHARSKDKWLGRCGLVWKTYVQQDGKFRSCLYWVQWKERWHKNCCWYHMRRALWCCEKAW